MQLTKQTAFALMLTTQLIGCQPPSQRTKNTGFVDLEEAVPQLMYLGKPQGERAEKCVRAVRIVDPILACSQNNCDIQAFHFPIRTMQVGQRAIYVGACSYDTGETSGDLLSDKAPDGGSAILYFQAHRSGPGMWRQMRDEHEFQIEFRTEAAEGVLRYADGKYGWAENPD